MIHEFLQRHAAWLKERIAWRLWTHDYARRRWLTMNSLRRARNAMDAGRCAHCFGTLDDPNVQDLHDLPPSPWQHTAGSAGKA